MKTSIHRYFAVLWIGLTLASADLRSQIMPRTEAQSLTGEQLILPAACAGHPTVLIIGFSHDSHTAMEHWDKQIGAQVMAKPGVLLYNVAVLEDAPRLIRSFITQSIKAIVPAEAHSRFLIVARGESDLKRAVNFSLAQGTYVVVLDGDGNIVLQTGGEPSEASKRSIIEGLGKTL